MSYFYGATWEQDIYYQNHLLLNTNISDTFLMSYNEYEIIGKIGMIPYVD